MENVQGYKLSGFPFENLVKVKDLLYYDGPLLSHFIDEVEETHYFYLWVDYNEEFNRWLIFRVDEYDLVEYLVGIEPLQGLIWKNKNEFLYIVDIDADVNYYNPTIVRASDLPNSYIPDEFSYFNSPIPEIYESLLATLKAKRNLNTEYVDALRNNAVFLKITPKSKKHSTVVSTYDASDFLRDISNSYLGFAEAKFAKDFFKVYESFDKFESAKKQVLSQVEPKLVQVGISSFAIGVASDFLSDNSNKSEFLWKKSIANEYKEQIINIDYSSDVELENIKDKFTDKERQLIFKPLIRIFKNKRFDLSITDYHFSDKRKIKVMPTKAETILLAQKQITEKERQEAAFELVTIIVEKPINESAEKLSKKSLQEGFLFSQPTKGFEYIFESIDYKDDIIYLKKPLRVRVTYENKVYTISIPELDIRLTTSQKEELLPLMKKELYQRISYLLITNTPLSELEINQSQFIQDYLNL
ncbi:hypothetical protein [Pontibacter russatus]|uniref:hypothetical protein n=1 Tax=Pontibacter russatus TaxID=2694929 RepID=UPI00137A2600|nr:hypothetical protein [Pontibacter russatus]